MNKLCKKEIGMKNYIFWLFGKNYKVLCNKHIICFYLKLVSFQILCFENSYKKGAYRKFIQALYPEMHKAIDS